MLKCSWGSVQKNAEQGKTPFPACNPLTYSVRPSHPSHCGTRWLPGPGASFHNPGLQEKLRRLLSPPTRCSKVGAPLIWVREARVCLLPLKPAASSAAPRIRGRGILQDAGVIPTGACTSQLPLWPVIPNLVPVSSLLRHEDTLELPQPAPSWSLVRMSLQGTAKELPFPPWDLPLQTARSQALQWRCAADSPSLQRGEGSLTAVLSWSVLCGAPAGKAFRGLGA